MRARARVRECACANERVHVHLSAEESIGNGRSTIHSKVDKGRTLDDFQ